VGTGERKVRLGIRGAGGGRKGKTKKKGKCHRHHFSHAYSDLGYSKLSPRQRIKKFLPGKLCKFDKKSFLCWNNLLQYRLEE
jgi:hypothetical protein